jgi:predicted SprT family Zn-dependent metalloprotease
MGVYLHEARAIRVHPALDRTEVPEFFVEAVIFHEMLHQVVPVEELGGRRVVHGREFRRRERAFPGHARAKAWERENLHVLLSTARRNSRPS